MLNKFELKLNKMKKILLTCAAAMSLGISAKAQLANGSVFPDFTVTDINGMPHNLYTDLNAGKTVIIDISATWCGPCWTYHVSGALDSMWAKHGPAGQPGVNATTTDDMVIYFFQGEPTSGMAQLTLNTIGSGAVTSGGTKATFTQGNWVAGTHYYIIDDSTAQGPRNTLWNIAYFPTVYMICRDHIVRELTQPTEAEAYAAAQEACPNYPPSATTDAKTAVYQSSDFFVCNANPTIRFQNYGTNNITAATITVKDGTGATVATVPWSGSLAPYAVASVPVPSFAGTSFGGYKYSVTVAGDSYAANDVSTDSVFKVYTAATASALPGAEDFTALPIPYKSTLSSPDGYIWTGIWNSTQVGPSGTAQDNSLIFMDYYASNGTQEVFVLGNYNTSGATNLKVQFDVAYRQYGSSDNDKLAVKMSTDCGATWTTVWTQSGSTLATGAVYSSGAFVPKTTGEWKHVSVDVPGTMANANTMVEFVNTSNYGNNIYVDNIQLTNAVDVPQVAISDVISLAPNPARDMTEISLSLNEATTVQVQVYDAVGRVVNTLSQQLGAGVQQIQLNTADLATGLYNVRISAAGTMVVKQLSVVK